jgi:phosphoribosylamine---glycine ligase
MEKAAFEEWRGAGSNPGLRGIVLYDALMHARRGVKILERNSRGGNTEQVCFLTTMLDDYVDVCYRMVDGSLKGIRFSNKASVVTCAVPLDYGIGPAQDHASVVVSLDRALALEKKRDGRLRVFPMDLRLDEAGRTLMGTSRSVAVAGLGSSTEEAHELSLEGVMALDGPFRHRSDVGSAVDIRRSKERLLAVRKAATAAPP